jgi:hypothetical protein
MAPRVDYYDKVLCPVLGDKRTYLAHAQSDADDPQRNSAVRICCDAQRRRQW